LPAKAEPHIRLLDLVERAGSGAAMDQREETQGKKASGQSRVHSVSLPEAKICRCQSSSKS